MQYYLTEMVIRLLIFVENIIYLNIFLSRWNRKFDGTKESLIDKSHKPLTPHPNFHTELELKWINNYIKRNPHITLCELWYKLKLNKGYLRHPVSLYRVLKKLDIITKLIFKTHLNMSLKNTTRLKN